MCRLSLIRARLPENSYKLGNDLQCSFVCFRQHDWLKIRVDGSQDDTSMVPTFRGNVLLTLIPLDGVALTRFGIDFIS